MATTFSDHLSNATLDKNDSWILNKILSPFFFLHILEIFYIEATQLIAKPRKIFTNNKLRTQSSLKATYVTFSHPNAKRIVVCNWNFDLKVTFKWLVSQIWPKSSFQLKLWNLYGKKLHHPSFLSLVSPTFGLSTFVTKVASIKIVMGIHETLWQRNMFVYRYSCIFCTTKLTNFK